MDHIHLIRTFLNDRYVATIAPSSIFAIRKLCRYFDFSKDITIVEYGAGTGVFSKYILKKMSPRSKLILVETNPLLCRLLSKLKDNRVTIINKSAVEVEQVLESLAIKNVDYVLSGIPFSLIDSSTKTAIFNATKNILHNDGSFLVYQVRQNIKKEVSKHFQIQSQTRAYINFPPLIMIEATKDTFSTQISS